MKKLEIIDFLKGYSIFTIIIFHFLQTLDWQHIGGKLISFGGAGVHLFILLSGFGLYLSHLSKPLSYFPFIIKRISKIYIPYIMVVLITALFTLFIPIFENSWYALGGHIFFYKMFDESIIGSYGYALWFISMIIQYYLIFHLIVFLRQKTNITFFLTLSLLLSLLWNFIILYIGKETERIWNSFFLKYLWEFALGMILVEYFKSGKIYKFAKIKKIYILWFGIFNCILYAFLALKAGNIGKMLNDIPALLGYSSIAVWIYLINNKIINYFFLFTGKISYALYLWHTFIMSSALYLFHNWSPIIIFPLTLLTIYIISLYYHKLLNYSFKKINI